MSANSTATGGTKVKMEKGSVIRALNHAQCQLIRAQRPHLLFYAADILARVAQTPEGKLLARKCPQAFRAAQDLAPFREGRRKLYGLMDFQMGTHIKEGLKALGDIAHEAKTGGPGMRSVYELTAAAHAYIAMADEAGSGPGTGPVLRFSRIDPYVTAHFVSEYVNVLSSSYRGTDYEAALSAQRGLLVARLGCKRPDSGRDDIAPASWSLLMDTLSGTADTLLLAYDRVYKKGSESPLEMATDFLFQTAASYDWQQYEKRATKPAGGVPPADRLRFPAA